MVRLAVLASLVLGIAPLIVEVVPAKRRLTPRVLFVVDASGSMKGPEFGRAVSAVRTVAAQPTDEMEFAVLAFNDDLYRWGGVDDEQTPKGWAALPSTDALEKASTWLSQQEVDGNTLVIPALQAALAESRDKLSVVLVTDGQFYNEKHSEILAALQAAQTKRVKAERGEVVLLVYGVGRNTMDVLRQIGTAGGGGYYQEQEEQISGVREK